jgi:hypothetical protein
MFQYRITFNDAMGAVLCSLPSEQWTRIADVIEERAGHAILERRFVTDADFLELIDDTTGYIRLGNRVVCPWVVFAELENR